MHSPFHTEFIAQSLVRFNENTPRIEKCLQPLSEEQVWQRPNAASNSIANLILHVCGNMTQYAIASLGGFPDIRKRDEEFAASQGFTQSELLEKLQVTVSRASAVIESLDEAELLRVRRVQGFEMSGIGIVVHVTEHYSYHTGQIAFWTKLLTNTDLGFYTHINLNQKNE